MLPDVQPHAEKSFEELMRFPKGWKGSPVRLPLLVRRILARLVSYDARLFALVIFLLNRAWGLGGRVHPNAVVREWSRLAASFSWRQACRFARAVADLDQHETFRLGSAAWGNRNSAEAFFYRSSFLDLFFKNPEWSATETSHPHQRPYYLVPGIPAQRYYEPEQFEWARTLEENFALIRDELLAVLQHDAPGFGTYQTEYSTTMPGWNTFALWLYGERHEENCARCPGTARVLESLPGFETEEWILFSALNPRSSLPPHVGPLNGILRAHLPLIVPPGCGLRVGGEDREWQEGRVLVFDDSFVHEVWNQSDQVRIVLFLNFWHPCLSQGERKALAAIRQAYHDTPVGKRWLERQERPLPNTIAAATIPS